MRVRELPRWWARWGTGAPGRGYPRQGREDRGRPTVPPAARPTRRIGDRRPPGLCGSQAMGQGGIHAVSLLRSTLGLIYDITGCRSAPLGGEPSSRAPASSAQASTKPLFRFPPRDARRCTSAATHPVPTRDRQNVLGGHHHPVPGVRAYASAPGARPRCVGAAAGWATGVGDRADRKTEAQNLPFRSVPAPVPGAARCAGRRVQRRRSSPPPRP